MGTDSSGRRASLTGMSKVSFVQFDQVLLAAVFALCAIGLVMVTSASSFTAVSRYGDAAYFLKRQAVAGVVGIA